MVAMLSAAVANDGVLMRPYLVEEVRLRDGTMINRAAPVVYRTAVPPVLARYLAAMMTIATPARGLGAAIPGVRVASRAATAATVPGGGEHALVTAFAPARAPEVAVGVVLERPGERAGAVGAVARAMIEAALA